MTTIKERILYCSKNQGLKTSEIAKILNMATASFKGQAKESTLNSDSIAKFLEAFPNINPYWLFNGKGDILKAKVKTSLADFDKLEVLNFIEDNEKEFLSLKEMQRFLKRMGMKKHYQEVVMENERLKELAKNSGKVNSGNGI